MAGCKKADRNRKKCPAMQRYKASNRSQTNKERRMRRDEKRQAKKSQRYFDGKIKERGLTRKARRSHGKVKQKNNREYNISPLAKALQRIRAEK